MFEDFHPAAAEPPTDQSGSSTEQEGLTPHHLRSCNSDEYKNEVIFPEPRQRRHIYDVKSLVYRGEREHSAT